ncbi:MAG: flagellar export chaperone FliS [Alcaligenaceae bacterium]|nr:flagellar export chaperone FliS [Alcaligenaceae bacterium]
MMPSTSPYRNTPSARSARTYARVGLETEVFSAPPERLISLLFRGARRAVAQARLHMGEGRVAERGQAISRAIDIVDSGLKAGVDSDRGGEVAQHLIAAYELIIHNLLQANLNNDPTKLDSADKLLGDLADAWQTAADPDFNAPATP